MQHFIERGLPATILVIVALLQLYLTQILLLYGSSTVLLDIPLRVLCGLMLLSPALLTSQVMWVLICGFDQHQTQIFRY